MPYIINITGRIVAGITVFSLANLFGLKMNSYVFLKGTIVTGIPGVIVQLILIPVLICSVNSYDKKTV